MWKDIKGFEGLYQVSDKGEVKSVDRYVQTSTTNRLYKGKALKPALAGIGYYKVTLYDKNKKAKNCYIHRLVAENFLDNPFNYDVVNHKDENKLNNSVDNLEWCTTAYNNTYGNALQTRADKHCKPIILLDLNGNFIREWRSAADVYKELGFHYSHISKCALGKIKKSYGYVWRFKEV